MKLCACSGQFSNQAALSHCLCTGLSTNNIDCKESGLNGCGSLYIDGATT